MLSGSVFHVGWLSGGYSVPERCGSILFRALTTAFGSLQWFWEVFCMSKHDFTLLWKVGYFLAIWMVFQLCLQYLEQEFVCFGDFFSVWLLLATISVI